MEDWECETCGFRIYVPVRCGGLRVSSLGLYSDARFPGRSILVYRRHVEHLELLAGPEMSAFWADAAEVAKALRRVSGAERINYAVLGNASPHLHVHLIPRRPSLEPLPSRPPWNDPRPLAELPGKEMQAFRLKLEQVLA